MLKPLRDNNLMVICRERDQQQGLMIGKTLMGKVIKLQVWKERGKFMGVTSGVSTELTDERIRVNVKGV